MSVRAQRTQRLRLYAGRRVGARLSIAAAVLLSLSGVLAQPLAREPLNSERIEARFGSYGVEVLESGTKYRVSNLFSGDATHKICRTFAVVRYPLAIDPAFAEEHAAILAGGSIGAVFTAAGWQVRKTHLFYGEVAATERLARLMHVAPGTSLAEHAYVLDVAKDGRALTYATLVEIHHPDYLSRSELPAIYGPASSEGRETLLSELLAAVGERLEP
jgi:hypothetical protein